MRQDIIWCPNDCTACDFLVPQTACIAHHRAIFEFISLDLEEILLVQQHDCVGHVPLFGNGQIQIIVPLRVPEVEKHGLTHIGVNARQQRLHLPIKVLNDLEAVMTVANLR